MNIYNDNGNDTNDILTGKLWLEKPKQPQPEPDNPVNLKLDQLPKLLIPNLLAGELQTDYLTKTKQLEHQLSQIQQENKSLKSKLAQKKEQNANLQHDLNNLSHQNATLCQEKHQSQQESTEKDQIIKQLTQDLINEREKTTATQNNLAQEKQINQSLRETNANLTQKVNVYEQNHANLLNAYQIMLKDKENAELFAEREKQRADHYEQQLKSIAQMLHQWQKISYYQQLGKNEFQAKIIHPPPWKT